MLTKENIAISMTQSGSPYENALAERINGTIKNDFFPKQIFQNHKEAKKVIAKSIQIYNEKRPHASVDYLTPEQAHLKDGIIKKDGKNIQPTSKKRKIISLMFNRFLRHCRKAFIKNPTSI